MTCIVGYVENGNVWIGGDSAGVGGYSLQIRADEKVFKKEDMVFGFTSSFRMGQIIRSCLQIPEQSSKKTDYDYLCSDFIDKLIACFKDKEYATIKDSKVKGGVFLLGYKGNLYNIESDFQVGKVFKNYNACGCGFDLALGALHALEDSKLTPEQKIIKALEAADEFSAGVRPPFNIVSLNEQEKTST